MAHIALSNTGGLSIAYRPSQSGADYIMLETADYRVRITLDCSEAEQLLSDMRKTLDKIKADRVASALVERNAERDN